MQSIMTRDRIDIEELNYDRSQRYLTTAEEKAQRNEAAKLATNPLMIEALYEMPENIAEALAGAIETGNVDKLAALVRWDVEEYLNENGGIEQWLS